MPVIMMSELTAGKLPTYLALNVIQADYLSSHQTPGLSVSPDGKRRRLISSPQRWRSALFIG